MVTSMVTRLPMTPPVLPLVSSHISGFFFWGMMDEPVEYLSSMVTNPNSWDDHRTSSSQREERLMAAIEASTASSVT